VAEFDHTLLDDVIHSRLRLAIMAVLASVERAEFAFLRRQVNATDGNLGAHLRKLEEAGYIRTEKHFVDRKPRTDCYLTDAGRSAFRNYVERLGSLVQSASPGTASGGKNEP
jgi:DNA-binding MarR family transcriptional regulator